MLEGRDSVDILFNDSYTGEATLKFEKKYTTVRVNEIIDLEEARVHN